MIEKTPTVEVTNHPERSRTIDILRRRFGKQAVLMLISTGLALNSSMDAGNNDDRVPANTDHAADVPHEQVAEQPAVQAEETGMGYVNEDGTFVSVETTTKVADLSADSEIV